MQVRPISVALRYFSKNLSFILPLSFFLSIGYFLLDLFLSYFNFLPFDILAYHSSIDKYIPASFGFTYIVKVIILVIFLAFIFAILARLFNVDTKQVLIRYRNQQEEFKNSANYKTKFTTSQAYKFIIQILKHNFINTYIRILIVLSLYVISCFGLTMPFYGLARAFSDIAFVKYLGILICYLMLIANTIFYVPTLALSVTSITSNPMDMLILSFNYTKKYVKEIAIVVVVFIAIQLVLKTAVYPILKDVFNYLDLGALGKLLEYTVSVTLYAFLTIFSIVTYFFILLRNNKDTLLVSHVIENQYKEDYHLAQNIITEYYVELQRIIKNKPAVSKPFSDNSQKEDVKLDNNSDPEEQSIIDENSLDHLASAKLTNTSKIKVNNSGNLFSKLFGKKKHQPNEKFARTHNQQYQFASDQVDFNETKAEQEDAKNDFLDLTKNKYPNR